MMTYRIKPEYLDRWGEDATTDTVITENELETIARGWETTPDALMDQLYEDTPENVRWYTEWSK